MSSHQYKQTVVGGYSGYEGEHFQATKELLDKVQHVISKLDQAEAEIATLKAKTVGDLQHQAYAAPDLAQLKSENESLKSEITRLKYDTRKYTEEIEARKDLLRTNEEFYQSKEIETKAIVAEYIRSTNKLKQENDRLKDVEKRLRKEKVDVEEELASTKLRLSKILSDKICDNNPCIADLSDENRPTKLGERYRQLYDNEWTEAYEVAEAMFKNTTDTRRISYLMAILTDVYTFCKSEFVTQDHQLIQSLCHSKEPQTLSGGIIKQLKDLKRYTATFGIDALTERCIKQRFPNDKLSEFALKVKPYLQECVAVCWLMVVQDPPVVLHLGVQRLDPFDKSMYSAYTMSGDRTDFVVWPALLLHENGPVLAKGTAHGLKSSSGNGQKGPAMSVGDMISGVSSLSMNTTAHVDENFQDNSAKAENGMVNAQKPLGPQSHTNSTVPHTVEGNLIDLSSTTSSPSINTHNTVVITGQARDKMYQPGNQALFGQQQQFQKNSRQNENVNANQAPNVDHNSSSNLPGYSYHNQSSAMRTESSDNNMHAQNAQSYQQTDQNTQFDRQHQPLSSYNPGQVHGGQGTVHHISPQNTPQQQGYQHNKQECNATTITTQNTGYQTPIGQGTKGISYQHQSLAPNTDASRQSTGSNTMDQGNGGIIRNDWQNPNNANQYLHQHTSTQHYPLADLTPGAHTDQAVSHPYGNAVVQGHIDTQPNEHELEWFYWANCQKIPNPMGFIDGRLGQGVYMKCWNWVSRMNRAHVSNV